MNFVEAHHEKFLTQAEADAMEAAGFNWYPGSLRFVKTGEVGSGTSVSFELSRVSGGWIACRWLPYANPSNKWTSECFTSLQACFVAANLCNWGQ